MGKRIGAIASAMGLLIALLVTTGAIAGTTGTDFTACLDEKGNLTNVAEGLEPTTPCKKNAHVVSWNSQGPEGLQGPQGADGSDGVAGAPGADGKDGHDGAPGRQGDQGTDGRDGARGADGEDGQDGAPGVDGPNGEPCTVVEEPTGTFTLTCPDGSSVTWGEANTTTETPEPPAVIDLQVRVQPIAVCLDDGTDCASTAGLNESRIDQVWAPVGIDIVVLDVQTLNSSDLHATTNCGDVMSTLGQPVFEPPPLRLWVFPNCSQGNGWTNGNGMLIGTSLMESSIPYVSHLIGHNLGLVFNFPEIFNNLMNHPILGETDLSSAQIEIARLSRFVEAAAP